jgi:hypothetical protein
MALNVTCRNGYLRLSACQINAVIAKKCWINFIQFAINAMLMPLLLVLFILFPILCTYKQTNIHTHIHLHIHTYIHTYTHIQGVPGGKVNILGGHSIGHSKQKRYMNMCPIPNGFRDRTIWLQTVAQQGEGKDNTGRPSQTTIQSNGSILETVRNRTHVHIKFFA